MTDTTMPVLAAPVERTVSGTAAVEHLGVEQSFKDPTGLFNPNPFADDGDV
ncbi:hypothetical protein [Spongiactinospora sp. 9N601]|uniref:hypothetical protein n=1 Tax=Spongiactinospora sp. 9N601 TaxID=3375149 RepID=UPI0037898D90